MGKSPSNIAAMDDNGEIIARIEAYCRRQSVAETTFGRLAVNDGKLVGRLRGGGSITLRTYRAVEAFLSREGSVEVQS